MKEFKSFYKTVTASEGDRCRYNTRLDVYGCGCAHDCSYCYAKSLLDFRGLWHPDNPSAADIKKIERKISKLKKGEIVRLGGMTDCFQPIEKQVKNTYKTIKLLNKYGIGYLIVTKSDLIEKYQDILDPELAHIQISVTSIEPVSYEHAARPQERIRAILSLQRHYDTAIRISPLIIGKIDLNELNGYGIKKAVVEFLRVNTWVKRWMPDIDFSQYTLKSGGYWHLPLETKINALEPLKIPYTVCEDVPEHWLYWQKNVNPNKNDCCNLEKRSMNKNFINERI